MAPEAPLHARRLPQSPSAIRRRRTAAALGAGLVAVVAAVLVVNGALGGGADPAPTPGDAVVVTEVPTGQTATEPAATGATEAAAPAGQRVDDPAADVADVEGVAPPEPVAGADLVGAELVRDGDAWRVAWEVAGPPPAQQSSLVWSVEATVAGELAYTISVQLTGVEAFTGIYDWSTDTQLEIADPPVIEGSRIAVAVPAEAVPRLDEGFGWSAVAELDGGFRDVVPDGALVEVAPAGPP